MQATILPAGRVKPVDVRGDPHAHAGGSIDWVDVLLVAMFFVAALAAVQFGPLSPLICATTFGMYAARSPARSLAAFTNSPLLLLLGFWTAFSVAWSATKGVTFYYSIQYLLTIAMGVLIGSDSRQRSEPVIAMFASFAIFNSYSLAFGHSVSWRGQGATAFAGLFEGKNFLGDIAAHGYVFSLAFIWMCLRARNVIGLSVAILAMAVQLYIIALARSSGAIIAVIETTSVFLSLGFLSKLQREARVVAAIGMIVLALAAAATAPLWKDALVDQLMVALDKDPTLSGREYLWQRADEIISDRPYLGTGYQAFWRKNNIDAEGLWRFADIKGRAGFNFHNTRIELLVHLGWVGLVLFGATLAVYASRLWISFILTPSRTLVMWVAVLVYEVGRMPYEAIGLSPFSHITTVLMACLAAGAIERPAFLPQPSSD